MADPAFLIDSEGRISFYGMWTHAPTLKKAIDGLLASDGRGISGGLDRTPHMFASFVDGWRGSSGRHKRAARRSRSPRHAQRAPKYKGVRLTPKHARCCGGIVGFERAGVRSGYMAERRRPVVESGTNGEQFTVGFGLFPTAVAPPVFTNAHRFVYRCSPAR